MAKHQKNNVDCKAVSDNLERIAQKIKTIPTGPGCYLWKGELAGHNTILYIGKSVSLRSRVRQYIHSDDHKTRFLMARVQDVEWVRTESEMEALLLENTLIKKHKPPYNIRLKDDKKYPYLCLTMGEVFPRLVLTRKKFSKDHVYFGPFSDVSAARTTMALIQKIFPVRKRPLKLPLKKPGRPCLNYHMGRCWAPCAGNVKEDEYRTMVQSIRDFLEGKSDEVENNLRKSMGIYAENLEYEKAARIRNILQDIEKTREEQHVEFPGGEADFDIIGVYSIAREQLESELNIDDASLSYAGLAENLTFGQIVLLRVRNGKLVAKRNYALSEGLPEEQDDGQRRQEIIETFFREYYLTFKDFPSEIILSDNFSQVELWQESLSKEAGFAVKLRSPDEAREKENLLKMAMTNARLSLSERILSEKLRNQRLGLRQIQKFLDLPELPRTIECYDISNISGKEAVGSGVMLKDGLPHKSGYRKYKIKNFTEPDDPGMMNEVLSRRMARIAGREVSAPDLIVIDGGITQLRAAIAARDAAGVRLPLIGLAKKREEIHTEDGRILKFNKDLPGMTILRLARDEAHRFGVAYHRNLRMKRNLKSILDAVKGVGEQRRKVFMNALRKIEIDRFDHDSLTENLQNQTSLPREICFDVAAAVLNH